jgi:hydroxypyruvate isomerase
VPSALYGDAMPRFAANLSLMYTEHPFVERFAAAAADGFGAVECQFPYAVAQGELARALNAAGLQQVLLNASPGRFDAGERGIAALPGREDEFQRGFVEQALPYAQALRCPRIHVMAGVVPDGADRSRLRATYCANLEWAARQAAVHGIQVLIEPLNLRDTPGYLLSRQDDAHAIVAEIGAVNLKVQMDLYHLQIVEGDVATKLRRYLGDPQHVGRVGHIQIASVPDRHEPDEGELHHPYLFALLDELGWREPVGAEYRPRAGTSAGLGWFARYKESRA